MADFRLETGIHCQNQCFSWIDISPWQIYVFYWLSNKLIFTTDFPGSVRGWKSIFLFFISWNLIIPAMRKGQDSADHVGVLSSYRLYDNLCIALWSSLVTISRSFGRAGLSGLNPLTWWTCSNPCWNASSPYFCRSSSAFPILLLPKHTAMIE